MSGVRLIDEPGGIRAIIFDTPNPTTGKFVRILLLASTVETRSHRQVLDQVRSWREQRYRSYLYRRQGIGNELGVCLTSWENFYRAGDQAVPVTNSIKFRAAGGAVPSLVGGGFLFDKVTNTTANGRGPAGCGEEDPPVVIDKTTRTRFAQPDDLITYRISVRNRGDAPVRRLRACDRAPRALRFVGARCVCGAQRAVDGASDPSAAARSAQDVPCHLPAARECHGGYRHQRRERRRPHRVRAVSVPARKRRHTQAAAPPARQGLRENQGGKCTPSLPLGAESPPAHAAC